MSKDDHFPIVGFVWRAFLFSVRFLLMDPVYTCEAGVRNRRQDNFVQVYTIFQAILPYASLST